MNKTTIYAAIAILATAPLAMAQNAPPAPQSDPAQSKPAAAPKTPRSATEQILGGLLQREQELHRTDAEQLGHERDTLDAALAIMKAASDAKDKTIDQQKADLDAVTKDRDKATAALSDNKKLIEGLNKTIDDLRATADAKDKTLSDWKNMEDGRVMTIHEQRQEIERLKAELAAVPRTGACSGGPCTGDTAKAAAPETKP